MRHSLRFRLTLWYALALLVCLAVFAAAIWTSMWRSLQSDVERTLDARLSSTQNFLSDEISDGKERLPEELLEYSEAFPEGTYIEVRGANDRRIFTTTPSFPWPVGSRESREDIRWKGARFRVVGRDMKVHGDRWHVTFAESLARADEMLARLRWLLLALIPAIVTLACIGGRWVSRRALKPVDDITAAARTIGIQDLSARLAVPQTGDELQRLSETWNDMLARLEDAVSRLSRFTADASHELRTPVAVIRSTAEIAGRKSRSEEAYRAALASIVHETEHMTALIEDLLFLARCDANCLDLSKESIRLDELLEDIAASMQSMAEEKGVRLQLTAPGPLAVWGNQSAIRRLVLILVDNALKYTRPGGTVRIAAHLTGEEVRVSVEDQGLGIPEPEVPLVFQRFYRGSQAREQASNGHGLGLALASGIAQQHRSAVEVKSRAGQGSTFEVALPVARDV